MSEFQNYLNFKPIFHSEVSNSYILYEVLQADKQIASKFISSIIKKEVNGEIKVNRETRIADSGNIDLFIETRIDGKDAKILIECKVHDYISTTSNQIFRYYDSATSIYPNHDIYFIYLTQFSEQNIISFSEISTPPTIDEFKNAQRTVNQNDKLFHCNWLEIHNIFRNDLDKLNPELQHIKMLQKKWIQAKTRKNAGEQIVDTGNCEISSYLPDVEFDISERLEFGRKKNISGREIWEIDLQSRSLNELNEVVSVIDDLSKSNQIVPFSDATTPEDTNTAIQQFLTNLIETNEWNLISFYSNLIALCSKSSHLKLNGSGVRGFSILTKVNNKGQISLCTLWITKHTVEFGLKR